MSGGSGKFRFNLTITVQGHDIILLGQSPLGTITVVVIYLSILMIQSIIAVRASWTECDALDTGVLSGLTKVLHDANPFEQSFKSF